MFSVGIGRALKIAAARSMKVGRSPAHPFQTPLFAAPVASVRTVSSERPAGWSSKVATESRIIGSRSAPVEDLLLLCHATGFCRQLWRPVLDELDSVCSASGVAVQTVSLDFSGHGDSWGRGDTVNPLDWSNFGPEDIAEALEPFLREGSPAGPRPKRMYGLGHSMGGANLLLSILAGAASFDKLVLYEPVLFPVLGKESLEPSLVEIVKQIRKVGPPGTPLSKRSLKRRAFFGDLVSAKEYFASKPLFRAWNPQVLDQYVHGALMPTRMRYAALPDAAAKFEAETTKYTLKCAPAFESQVYLGEHDAFHRVRELPATCDVLICAGANSLFVGDPATTARIMSELAGHMPCASVALMEGCTHFGPMEKPITLARTAARHFAWMGPKRWQQSKVKSSL